MATAWQDTAFPVPVHAAAMMGDMTEESRAKTVVMDKKRRMLQMQYTFILAAKAIGFRVVAEYETD